MITEPSGHKSQSLIVKNTEVKAGENEEIFFAVETSCVSDTFSFAPHATHVEDTKLGSWKQKMFLRVRRA